MIVINERGRGGFPLTPAKALAAINQYIPRLNAQRTVPIPKKRQAVSIANFLPKLSMKTPKIGITRTIPNPNPNPDQLSSKLNFDLPLNSSQPFLFSPLRSFHPKETHSPPRKRKKGQSGSLDRPTHQQKKIM